jgi:hypothetical protein
MAVLRPEAAVMQFDKGTADGEPHAHSILLGCEKCLEGSVWLSQTDTAVLYFYPDRTGVMNSGALGQCSPAIGERLHRI